MAISADNTAILSSDPDPVRATEKLQHQLNLLQTWLEHWRIKVNPTKTAQVTFTTRRDICLPVNLHNTHIRVKKEVKYLGLHLDEKLKWKKHINSKRCQMEIRLKNMSCLINTRSQVPLDSKLTVEKTILRPTWTYGIELWGCSKPSNTKILQTFQFKMLRMFSNAPWHVSNQILHNDFEIPYVTEVIRINTNKYKNRSTVHSNQLIGTLFNPLVDRRVKQLWPEDSPIAKLQ